MADTTAPDTGDLDRSGTPRAETARDAARERFQRLSSDVQDRYRQTSEDVRRGAERARAELRRGTERARDTYVETTENVRRGYATVRSQAADWTNEASAYVRENPGRSVLIAAGVGFVLGLLLRGRRDEDEF